MAPILLTAAVLVNGCGRASAPPPVEDNRFAVLLADILVLQKKYADHPDSLVIRRTALLDSAEVTERQIRDYIHGLRSRPDDWVPLLDRVEARLDSALASPADITEASPPDSASIIGSVKAERYRAE